MYVTTCNRVNFLRFTAFASSVSFCTEKFSCARKISELQIFGQMDDVKNFFASVKDF